MTTSAVSQINLFGNAQNAASNVKNGQNDSFSQIFASQAENADHSKRFHGDRCDRGFRDDFVKFMFNRKI